MVTDHDNDTHLGWRGPGQSRLTPLQPFCASVASPLQRWCRHSTPAIPVSIGVVTYSRGSVTEPRRALAATVRGLAR